jgi:hypothetical protein
MGQTRRAGQAAGSISSTNGLTACSSTRISAPVGARVAMRLGRRRGFTWRLDLHHRGDTSAFPHLERGPHPDTPGEVAERSLFLPTKMPVRSSERSCEPYHQIRTVRRRMRGGAASLPPLSN